MVGAGMDEAMRCLKLSCSFALPLSTSCTGGTHQRVSPQAAPVLSENKKRPKASSHDGPLSATLQMDDLHNLRSYKACRQLNARDIQFYAGRTSVSGWMPGVHSCRP